MSDKILVQYDGIDILYDEKSDSWNFTLRGRDRKAESLAKAKEAIDKPVKEDKPAFERIKCYKYCWDSWITGEVTSIAADRPYDDKMRYVWFVSDKDSQRTKENSSQLFPINEKTTQAIKTFNELTDQMNSLKKLRDELHRSMEKLKID